jgi:hypothetical protein
MNIKARALAVLRQTPSEAKLMRLSQQVDTAVTAWKARLDADPALADVALEDLLPVVSAFVRMATTLKKMEYTDALSVEVAHKLMADP